MIDLKIETDKSLDFEASLDSFKGIVHKFKGYLRHIRSIVISDFSLRPWLSAMVEERSISSFFWSGTLYVDARQLDDEDDLVDDLIHEFFHLVERSETKLLKSPEMIREFINLRIEVINSLASRGIRVPESVRKELRDPNLSVSLDRFLLKTDKKKVDLSIKNKFLTEYSLVSISEYWAVAATEMVISEFYFNEYGNSKSLKKTKAFLANNNPILFKAYKEIRKKDE